MPDVVKIMMGLTGKEKPHFFLLPTAGRDGADEQDAVDSIEKYLSGQE